MTDSLFTTDSYIQYLVINYIEKNLKKYICVIKSLCYTLETNTIL